MPGYVKDLQFLVRSTKKKSIFACLVGIPKNFIMCGQKVKMLEVNFLAVHQKVRKKKLAQIVI
jgi:glycylpeptide N-tetradecanoyltransferase